MLDTTFSYYTQNGDKSHTKKIRTLHYSVPADVSNHITMVQPTTRFGKMMAEKSNVFIVAPALEEPTPPADLVPGLTIDPSCNTVITPACLRALYNVGDYQADPHVGTLLGVNGFLEQYAKYDNFEEFKRIYAPYAKRQTFDFVKINGGLDTQNDSSIDDVEANLDIQYAAALGYKQKIKFYSTGGRGPLVPDLDQPDPNESSNEPYLDFLNYITALPDRDLPQTLTTSYGEDEQSVPEPYVRKVCKMFGELGMRGVSVIFSSGDTGVASACQTNDGKNATRFLPIFPAACPYVTSVSFLPS
jgi:tripeptidyl-peptidase-1